MLAFRHSSSVLLNSSCYLAGAQCRIPCFFRATAAMRCVDGHICPFCCQTLSAALQAFLILVLEQLFLGSVGSDVPTNTQNILIFDGDVQVDMLNKKINMFALFQACQLGGKLRTMFSTNTKYIPIILICHIFVTVD